LGAAVLRIIRTAEEIVMNSTPGGNLLADYAKFVATRFPNHLTSWPLISNFGHKVLCGKIRDVLVYIFCDTGGALQQFEGIGDIQQVIGADHVGAANAEPVRAKLVKRFSLNLRDAVFFEGPGINPIHEYEVALRRHQRAIGMSPDKIFLSHNSADKNLVRDFKEALELLGFSPWLDEHAMSAGASLNRTILQGFEDSCAAVFFVTPNFRDERFLADEVDYAIDQKQKKICAFSIITLVFEVDGMKGDVPLLLRKYVWKEPRSYLDALREILRALPIKVGEVHWR
jgi:hypothetical protein